MTKEAIDKAFEGRWRIKANLDGTGHVKGTVIPFVSSEHQEEILSHIKELCRDFFTTGILLADPHFVQSGGILTTTPKTSVEVVCNDFGYWWKLYDKMVGRKDCEKKWEKLSLGERYACIRATPAYVASTPDKQFRKNPLSYLNQKAWNDEIIPHGNGNTKPTSEQQQSKLADILVG